MVKKITIIACIVIFLAFVCVTIALSGEIDISSCAGKGEVSIDRNLLTEIKIGKYYLEGGTENEYIEVYDDGTLQIFGLDYLQLVIDNLNPDYLTSLTEEEYKEFVDAEQVFVDFWNSRHYYGISDYVKRIFLQDEPIEPGQIGSKSGFGIDYTDENTLIWDDEHIYKYAE